MLAGRKRKRKCSTGKVLTASAARPNARWTERGNREEENGSLTGRFSHTASAARPNARWTERGNREEGVLVNKGLVSFFDVESVGPDIALESI